MPSRRPNTTREEKEQGRSRKETTAPPTVCFPGLPYMEGAPPKGLFLLGEARLYKASQGAVQLLFAFDGVGIQVPNDLFEPPQQVVKGHFQVVKGP